MDRRSLLHFVLVIGLLSKRTHSTAIPGSELDQSESCNTCCRGLQGINGIPGAGGIPGSPGNNGSPGLGRDGIPGRDGLSGRDAVGLKGDNGSKGEKGDAGVGIGERGPSGPQGPLGERGEPGARGLAGKVGPIGAVGPIGPIGAVGPIGPIGAVGPIGLVGPSGVNGATGRNGAKGERGLQGINGEHGQQRKSAFSVQKTGTQITTTGLEIVTFEEARINAGDDFNLSTDRFVCRIPGVYFFTFSAHVTDTTGVNPDIYLVKDGITEAHARSELGDTHVSSATMLNLLRGNQVWLRFGNSGEGIEGADDKCQFSGFLLYEQL